MLKIPNIGISPRTRLLTVVGIVLLAMFIHHRISRMDQRFFFYNSLHSAKGLTLYLVGDYRGAAKAYRAHYRQVYDRYLDPGDSEWYALLRGDFQKAKELAQKALERNPFALHSQLTLGEIAIEEKMFDEALRFFKRVLQKDSDQSDALLLSSIVYAQQREYGKAIDSVNRALRDDGIQSRITSFLKVLELTGDLSSLPSEKKPLCLLAHYYRYLGIFDPSNTEKAVHFARQAIDAVDRPDDAYLTLGIAYSKESNTEEALKAFLRGVHLNPKNAEALRYVSRTYGERGDLLNEYNYMKLVYELERTDLFYAKTFSYLLTDKLGDYLQALAVDQKAILIDPNDINTLLRLGSSYSYLGDYARSVEYYQKATLLKPNMPGAYEAIGDGLRNLGQLDQAVLAYRKATSTGPRRASAHTGLAFVYFQQKRYDEAITEYEQGLAPGGNNLNDMRSLCNLYMRTSKFQGAADCYRQVLARYPNDVEAQRLLSDSLKNLQLARPEQ